MGKILNLVRFLLRIVGYRRSSGFVEWRMIPYDFRIDWFTPPSTRTVKYPYSFSAGRLKIRSRRIRRRLP